MGSGKGSTQTTEVKLPEELQQGAVGTLGAALQSASLPYAPNRGVTIAGFSPQQEAAFQGANAASSAFGLGTGAGGYMPQQEIGAGGVKGYSTGALYDQNVERSMSEADQLRRSRLLENYGTIGDTILSGKTLGGVNLWGTQDGTGATSGSAGKAAPQGGGGGGGSSSSGGGGSSGGSNYSSKPKTASQSGGGYTSFGDMFDGGGAGASGDTFQGGVSAISNKITTPWKSKDKDGSNKVSSGSSLKKKKSGGK